MRYILPAILIVLAFTGPARADYSTGYADLVCDPASNTALARFNEAEDTDPPHYAKLPAAIDHGLSSQAGTGRRVCQLANGWEIKLRSGVKQAFAYGEGGAAPPYFFSLWIDRRKVISRQNWSDENYAETEPEIAGVVITPTRITTCARKDEDKKLLTCTAKPLELDRYKIDDLEYPLNNLYGPTPAQLVVTAGTDAYVCRSIIRHGPNSDGVIRDSAGEPDLPVPAKDLDWIDWSADPFSGSWPSASLKDTFGMPVDGSVYFPPSAADFDGDGKADTVIELESDTHYFDGSYYVVAPGTTPVIDMVRALFSNSNEEDVEKDIGHAEGLGWHVYSGGRPGLYPDVSPRYVNLNLLSAGAKTYLVASPTNQDVDPTAIVIAPKPDGSFDTVCTIQRPRLNY